MERFGWRPVARLVATHDPDVIAAADEVVVLRSPLASADTPALVRG